MVTGLLIILIVSLIGIVTTIVVAIRKAGAYSDYYMALWHLKNAINVFTS